MNRTSAAVLAALLALDAEDPFGLFGPQEVAERVRENSPDSRMTKSLACTHLRKLVEAGKAERVSRGLQRGLYRAIRGKGEGNPPAPRPD